MDIEKKLDLPTGIQVWIPGTDLDLCLEQAVKKWIHENPQEVNDFARYIKEKKDTLHRKDGMTVGGTMKEYLEIPQSLAYNIQCMTHRDWVQDKKIMDRIKKLMPGLLCYAKNESSITL